MPYCKLRNLRFESLEQRLVLATVPVGFTDTQIYSGLPANSLQFDDFGRGWVGFDDGRIGLIENDVLVSNNLYDLQAATDNDLGLYGIELDRNFNTNGYIYVSYAADDADPNPKLSRLEVDLTTGNTIVPNSETVILELPSFSAFGDPSSHILGAVHHASDGTLYLQTGDYQLNTPAQDLSSPLGKVLRLNTDGTPAIDNPFYDSNDGIDWTDFVWASGLRNPFTGDIDPVTGRYFISEVGAETWEEINDATQPGLNFGWPSEEGATGNLSYTDPFYAYSHSNGCAITGGTFYSGVAPQFPAEYQGLYFFSDLCTGEIRTVDPNDHHNVSVFASGIVQPLNIAFAPDGSMFYIDYSTGGIHKVEYTLDSPPVVSLQPADALATVGGDASFSVSVAGTSPFTYHWQEDNGGGFVDITGATSAQLVLNSLALTANGNQYRVVVTNSFGTDTSLPATLTVTTDTPPVPSITISSTSGTTYVAGDTITFSGVANDVEDGVLPPSAFSWAIDFHHNVHTHPVFASLEDVDNGQLVVPTTGETDPDVWYRVYLTVTDSAGFQSTTFAEIFPELSDFSVEATGSIGSLLLDGQTAANPVQKTGVEGVFRTLSVPDSVGSTQFISWVDGVTTSERTIATPTDDTAYVALNGIVTADVQTTYVSDLTPVGTPINGWGPIELDMSVGGQGQGDGGTLLLNGVAYAKGLGVHADSEVIYDLAGNYSRFASDIGLNAGPRPNGEVIFEVYGDGTLLYSSGVMTGNSATQTVDVDVAGVSELRLVVDGNGSIDFDSANWADARVVEVTTAYPTGVRGKAITGDDVILRLLPYTAADATLDTKLDSDDVFAVTQNWGPRPSNDSFQQWIQSGDFNLDGFTDQLDWQILSDAWLGTYGLALNLEDFFSEQTLQLGSPDLLAEAEIVLDISGAVYEKFLATVGPLSSGQVTFSVFGDGDLLFGSGEMTDQSPPQNIDVDLAGVRELRLVAEGLATVTGAIPSWFNPSLVELTPQTVVQGDFVEDNGVTGLDFLALQRGFGIANPLATRADGDADFDGDVDAADLSHWQSGYLLGSATSSQELIIVHAEPSTDSGNLERGPVPHVPIFGNTDEVRSDPPAQRSSGFLDTAMIDRILSIRDHQGVSFLGKEDFFSKDSGLGRRFWAEPRDLSDIRQNERPLLAFTAFSWSSDAGSAHAESQLEDSWYLDAGFETLEEFQLSRFVS